MIVIFLLEFALVSLFLAMIVTQIILPVLQNRPLFPMLRKTEVSLLDELEAVNQELREQELKEEVNRRKQLVKHEVPEELEAVNQELREQELKEEVDRKKQLIKSEVPEVKNESNEEIK